MEKGFLWGVGLLYSLSKKTAFFCVQSETELSLTVKSLRLVRIDCGGGTWGGGAPSL